MHGYSKDERALRMTLAADSINYTVPIALCNLWSGVMEWSLGVEPWSGVLDWILEWNEDRSGVIVALLGQDLVLIDQFLVNAYLRCTLHLIPFVSFAMCRSHALIKL